MSIATQRPSAVVIAPTFSPASGDLKVLIEAKREGYLWRSDLTPDRVQAVRKQLADAERACLPPNLVVVASWLMKLTKLVTNAPADLSRELTEAIFEVCGDIPAGAWNPESRLDTSVGPEWLPGWITLASAGRAVHPPASLCRADQGRSFRAQGHARDDRSAP
ncbi:hypothetical protein [Gluconobacter wancherniae]|uniref:Uncharacterized protein n=1 Tax=Gluconobacter wancherniae NBRC 103581 TaxID=656744 RepID=A0A511AYD1_9PROT|nr:hypothetical protein [Gluconobacter wancherniae]MBF0853347.1 hypothetical protein [Gluconobacter wancherniae]GBD55920.1 hypothetical protein NBRC103581_00492 [Gluconobacter wancherniae NBRC 103581]GBR65889.1 hypothetical protein AA103581_2059 [Gluconobacter wancherniae NBRC 103581]GEK93176.1 hypothetical protein GWA01_09460 [Gluconobacter wancherniae NBRC 103581]